MGAIVDNENVLTKEAKTITTYFVMAFNVNGGKKEIRHEIVKDDRDKAIALAED